MRKLTIPNYRCMDNSYRGDSIVSYINQNLLRMNQHHQTVNPFARKLKSPPNHSGMKWLKDKQGFVIINDSRQEIACVGQRGLLTTSLILEECLQVNRGNQNHDYERNKFFTKDNECGNNRDASSMLSILDILWFMNEQGIDGLEILADPIDERDSTESFKSKRYCDITKGYRVRIEQLALAYLPKRWGVYKKAMLKEDGGKVDWTKNWRGRELKGVDRQMYASDDALIQNYYSDMEVYDDDDKPIITMRKWLKDKWLPTLSYTPSQECKMLMTSFGFAQTTLIEEMTEDTSAREISDAMDSVFQGKISTNDRLVRESKFKRNPDWSLGAENLVRAEAMKLRRLMKEGTFDE